MFLHNPENSFKTHSIINSKLLNVSTALDEAELSSAL